MKTSNQRIVDQDEVTTVSVNKSLLSVDYASALMQHLEEFVLIRVIQRTLKSLTTSKKVKLALKSQRSICFPDCLISLLTTLPMSPEEEAP